MFRVQKVQRLDVHGLWSVGLEHTNTGLVFWLDVWIQEDCKDISADWNQYIFSLDDSLDLTRKALQEDLEVFEEAASEAISILEELKEVFQDDRGEWYCSTEKTRWEAREWTTWDLTSMNLI